VTDKWTDGDAYEAYVGRWSRRIAERFLGWLGVSGGRWLDLGCGTGALTLEILSRCDPTRVTGVEPSEGFLALARDRIRDARAEFRFGSGAAVPLADGEVDVAVSGFVLNFIPDQPQAMEELKRAVAPGGTIAGYVWDYAGDAQFIRLFWDAAVTLDPAASALHEGTRFPLCRPEPLRKLFESTGLQDVQTAPIDILTRFATFDDYWQPFLGGIGPAPGYCASLDDDARQRLMAKIRQSLPLDPDGAIPMQARAWAVRGMRR
jgi:SAM-dependent methyltransferase